MRRYRLLLAALVTLVLIFSFCGTVFANEYQTELTIQDAVEKALERSKELKKAEMEKAKAAELRENAQKQISYIPSGYSSPEVDSAYAGLVQAELNYQIRSKDIKELEQDIARLVIEKYCNVLVAQNGVKSAEKSLAFAEWNMQAADIRCKVGLISPIMVEAAKANKSASLAASVQAREHLANSFEELNILMGFGNDHRPNLTSTITYPKIVVENLDTEVNRAIDHSQTVWRALQLVTIEEQDLEIFSPASEPYEIRKLDIDIAELTAAQAKEELKKHLLALYHSIVTLEGSLEAGTQAVTAAEKALQAATLRYQVGFATKGDVLEAEANLLAAKSNLNQLRSNHSIAVASFRKVTGRPVLPEEVYNIM